MSKVGLHGFDPNTLCYLSPTFCFLLAGSLWMISAVTATSVFLSSYLTSILKEVFLVPFWADFPRLKVPLCLEWIFQVCLEFLLCQVFYSSFAANIENRPLQSIESASKRARGTLWSQAYRPSPPAPAEPRLLARVVTPQFHPRPFPQCNQGL